MKALYTSLIVAGLLATTGCNTSPTGGSTGGTGSRSTSGTSGTGSTHGETTKATFKLSGPTNIIDTSVKRNEPVTKEISIDTGKDFKSDLAFDAKVEGDAKGLTATVEPKHWKNGNPKKVELHIKAADDTPEGEYTIHVTGTPTDGKPTTVDVKVKVPTKK